MGQFRSHLWLFDMPPVSLLGTIPLCGTCPMFQGSGQGHCLIRLVFGRCSLPWNPGAAGGWVSCKPLLDVSLMLGMEVNGPFSPTNTLLLSLWTLTPASGMLWEGRQTHNRKECVKPPPRQPLREKASEEWVGGSFTSPSPQPPWSLLGALVLQSHFLAWAAVPCAEERAESGKAEREALPLTPETEGLAKVQLWRNAQRYPGNFKSYSYIFNINSYIIVLVFLARCMAPRKPHLHLPSTKRATWLFKCK